MKKLLNEFKEFAVKGNVIDMAVGVIIGTAFGKIVTSLVNDVVMPALGLILGRINLASLSITIHDAMNADGTPIKIAYGVFLQNILDFLIVAMCIFLAVKGINALKKKGEGQSGPEEEPAEKLAAEAPPLSKEELLLTEIRDILRSNQEA